MALLTLRERLARRSTPLEYPSSDPRFNPAHIAAKNMAPGRGASFVAMGSTLVDMVAPAKVTRTGVTTGAVLAHIGPVCLFPSNTGVKIDGLGQSGVAGHHLAAFILQPVTISGSPNLLQIQGSGTYFLSAGNVSVFNGGTKASGIVLSANTPYFVAIANDTSSALVNVVVKDLVTSITRITTITAFSFGTTSQLTIGAPANTGNSIYYAAVMYGRCMLTIPELLAWSNDPWSFWYPRPFSLDQLLATPTDAGVSGTLGATEAPDTAAFNADFAVQGALAAIEAIDIAALTGNVAISGILTAIESADIAAFSGAIVLTPSGALLATELSDLASMIGTYVPARERVRRFYNDYEWEAGRPREHPKKWT